MPVTISTLVMLTLGTGVGAEGSELTGPSRLFSARETPGRWLHPQVASCGVRELRGGWVDVL